MSFGYVVLVAADEAGMLTQRGRHCLARHRLPLEEISHGGTMTKMDVLVCLASPDARRKQAVLCDDLTVPSLEAVSAPGRCVNIRLPAQGGVHADGAALQHGHSHRPVHPREAAPRPAVALQGARSCATCPPSIRAQCRVGSVFLDISHRVQHIDQTAAATRLLNAL